MSVTAKLSFVAAAAAVIVTNFTLLIDTGAEPYMMMIFGALMAYIAPRPNAKSGVATKSNPKGKMLLTVAVLLLAGCRGPGSVGPGELTRCAPPTSALLGAVSGALMEGGDARTIGDRALGELEALAIAHGASTVACVVDHLVTSWRARPGVAGATGWEPGQDRAADRGADYLVRVGARTE